MPGLIKRMYMSTAGLLIVMMISGCSRPEYYKEITTTYDADGKIVGTEIKEGISQQSGSSHSLNVNLNHKQQLVLD